MDPLRQKPGVQSVTMAGWVPLSHNRWTMPVRSPEKPDDNGATYFNDVASGYFSTMGIGWIGGRDFRAGDGQPKVQGENEPLPGVGIVNEAFARKFFHGENPVGRTVSVSVSRNLSASMEVVGYVRDSCYWDVRETMMPTVFVPVESRSGGAIIVRTSGNPGRYGPALRREIQTRPNLLVAGMDTEAAVVLRQMVSERLLAAISLFFAVVALVLAAVGLYGVLNYSVVRSRREIGIRLALGAGGAQVAQRVTGRLLGLVLCGVAIGVLGGLASERLFATILFEVRANDPVMVGEPIVVLLVAALLAALPPAIRAVGIDPAEVLRSE